MARKQAVDLKSADKLVEEAVEEWKAVSELKYELAKEAYDMQDEKTQHVIDRILKTLQVYATGYINVRLPRGAAVPVKVENEYLTYNLLWLALEIVKDLAITGVRVATFKFPPSVCAACGADIIPEKTPVPKGRRY